jgi:hypothetical protein
MHIRDKRSAEEEDDEDFTELSNLKKLSMGVSTVETNRDQDREWPSCRD